MKRLLIAPIRFYQRHISPHTPGCCRFYPTCSQYAVESLERFGALKGSGLAIWRILRCNPFGGHGYDPVPMKQEKPPRGDGSAHRGGHHV
ncbi:MAG: membrane protein insertion efficiency factor YidD [Clostridia bacterium]|nr:membrane protein insertion efficiency factor YidD [Clostridia bacterium]